MKHAWILSAVFTPITLLCAIVSPHVRAIPPESEDARAIMRAVYDRPIGDRALSRVKMTIRSESGVRERALTIRSKRYGEFDKTLLFIESPADVRNTAILTVVYKARDKTNEQWMYLPALHRVTRVPESGRSDAFMGSDFSYADMSERNPEDYDVKMLQASVRVDGDDCWLMEAVPSSDRVRDETGYSKAQLWVSKAKLIPIQIKAWVIKGEKVKYMKATDVRNVDGFWTPYQLQARTMKGNKVESETVLQLLGITYESPEITDADFTQARLSQGI